MAPSNISRSSTTNFFTSLVGIQEEAWDVAGQEFDRLNFLQGLDIAAVGRIEGGRGFGGFELRARIAAQVAVGGLDMLRRSVPAQSSPLEDGGFLRALGVGIVDFTREEEGLIGV